VETLAERITREGPINELDAVGWIVRLAKKLESMHSRGLAHGAVSPDAMKTASASRLSLGMLIPTGAIRSRLEYRSPERLDTGPSSPTDDAWGTAATLYALITGSSPFVAADDATTRKKIREGVFAPLSSFDVGDDDLQHIIEAALNPNAAQRTASLAAFREALEGWHPDSKVRELPPMVDDQPEDDDDDARTVMRPVSAADAVRALMAQREQAARASEPAAPAATPAKANPSPSNESVGAQRGGPAKPNHGLLEDDDENAKTAMISVSPLAMIAKVTGAPATVPAPPPENMTKSTPPPGAQGKGFGMMRSAGAAPARTPGAPAARTNLAKGTIAGGFTAKAAMEQAQKAAATPAYTPQPPPVPGISREAVLEDVDNDATVMREAPAEVLRRAKSSIAPPADRKTPVDPISAAVAARTAVSTPPPAATNPASPPAETSMSFGSISLVEEISETGSVVEPRETPVSPSKGLNVKAILAGTTPAAAANALGQTPGSATPTPAPTPGLATSALTSPSTSGMLAPPIPQPASALGLNAPSTPGMRAPVATPVPVAPPAPPAKEPAPAPMVAPEEEQPSAVKGLFIGVGIAVLILVAAAAVYFFVLKP
jgi:hypothetical protein